jgi:hypothetical protein
MTAGSFNGAGISSGVGGGLASGLVQEGIDFAQGDEFEFEEVVGSVVLGGISGIVPGALCGYRGGSFNPREEVAEGLIEQVGGICIGAISSAADAIPDALDEP